MIVLVKASIILMVLLAFYKLVLERESFFTSNRVYLLACLIFAIALPFIPMPKLVNNQGYVTEVINRKLSVNNRLHTTDLDNDMALVSNQIAQSQEANYNPTISVKDETETPIINQNNNVESISSINWILMIYLFGVVVLTLNLLAQIISTLRKAWKANDKIEDDGYVIVNLEGEVEPCSFFQYIFINPILYDYDTYDQILTHEKIHVDQKHTVDLIFSELAVIAFWFNPFVWLLRKEIEKNIEYQTDALLLETDNNIKESYQLNLVDIASKTRPLAITTNYNQSLIKQRIIKMNGKRSHKFNYWKYTFMLPLLFLLLLGLNRPLELNATVNPQSENTLLDIDNPERQDTILNEEIKQQTITNRVSDEEIITTTTTDTEIINIADNLEIDPVIESLPPLSIPKPVNISFTDCKEFEEAVARGDLNRVKEILKTLDPDCLKTAKGILEDNKEVLSSDQVNTNSEPQITSEESICKKLEKAVDSYDDFKARSILLNEDVSCLKDIYGYPTRDEDLVKGLLRYGAKMSIDNNGIIHISDVSFTIHIPKEGNECKDPDYLELADAIMAADRSRIRKLLASRDFDCPLNTDGVSNDFPFIKQIMKYRPELFITNRRSVTIHGVGVDIDIHAFDYDVDQKNNYNSNSDNYQETISELDRIMQNGYKNVLEPGCLDLLNAVDQGDISRIRNYLENNITDCYHKVTETYSGPLGSTSVTHTITPLILASAHGDIAMMKFLIENDADVNYQGDGSETALMYAVESSKLEAVIFLLEEGAKINAADDKGYSALDYAELYKHRDIIRYLKSKGAVSGGRGSN